MKSRVNKNSNNFTWDGVTETNYFFFINSDVHFPVFYSAMISLGGSAVEPTAKLLFGVEIRAACMDCSSMNPVQFFIIFCCGFEYFHGSVFVYVRQLYTIFLRWSKFPTCFTGSFRRVRNPT